MYVSAIYAYRYLHHHNPLFLHFILISYVSSFFKHWIFLSSCGINFNFFLFYFTVDNAFSYHQYICNTVFFIYLSLFVWCLYFANWLYLTNSVNFLAFWLLIHFNMFQSYFHLISTYDSNSIFYYFQISWDHRYQRNPDGARSVFDTLKRRSAAYPKLFPGKVRNKTLI